MIVCMPNFTTQQVSQYLENNPDWVEFVSTLVAGNLSNLSTLRRVYDIDDCFTDVEVQWMALGEILETAFDDGLPTLGGLYSVFLQCGYNEVSWEDVAKHLIYSHYTRND